MKKHLKKLNLLLFGLLFAVIFSAAGFGIFIGGETNENQSGFASAAENRASVTVDGQTESFLSFKQAWEKALSVDSLNHDVSVQLKTSVYAVDGSFDISFNGVTYPYVYIPSGKDITLDIQGFTLSRALTEPVADGYVIRVEGALSIIGDYKYSVITGGNNTGDGGAVFCAPDSDFTLTNVNIKSCYAARGGGIAAIGANLYDLNAKITECYASGNGGGVYLLNSQISNSSNYIEFKISSCVAGGKGGAAYLENCKSDNQSQDKLYTQFACWSCRSDGDGGGVYVGGDSNIKLDFIVNGNSGHCGGGLFVADTAAIDLTSITITSNKSESDGGGAYISNDASVNAGSLVCYTNVSGGDGGIYLAGSLTLYNHTINKSAKVYNNYTANKRQSNIYLPQGNFVKIDTEDTENESYDDFIALLFLMCRTSMRLTARS